MKKHRKALLDIVNDTKHMSKDELQTKFDAVKVGCVGTAVLGQRNNKGGAMKHWKRDAISISLVAIGMVGLAFSYEILAVKVWLGVIVGGFTIRLYTGDKL